MVATVNASTSAGVVITPDNSGVLALQSSSATALTIDASQNSTFVGTASATKLIPTGTSVTGNGLYLPAANSLGLSTNGTNAVYIDSSQNVGIGTTSPAGRLHVSSTSDVEVRSATTGANYATFRIKNSTNDYSMQIRTDQSNAWVLRDETAGLNRFYVSTNTAPRFGFGTGSIITATTQGMFTGFAGTGGQTFNFGPNQTGSYVVFSGTTGVYIDAGNTSWSSTSDERVKENLIPIENGLTKVASLRAVTGNFIDDEAKKSRAFLIAQDVQAVLPEAISIQKDEQQTLGIQYTDVIPLLVASIKELKAINDTLTARIVALENR
jgi:hypothetical protein